MKELYTERQNGYEICVNIRGNIDEYAKSFLTIYNNARESPDTIAHVENNYDNRVYVTVYEKAKERAIEWLKQFGEIKSVNTCDIYKICADYPYSSRFYDDNKESDPVFITKIY